MPAIPLAEPDVSILTDYVRSLNATAFETKPDGDSAAGERFFFGEGKCSGCHTAAGAGGSRGPDLSSIAKQLTLAELEQSLTDPSARIAPGYGVATVQLKNGATIRGFARSRGSHDLQLQTFDGAIRLVDEKDFSRATTETASL